MLFTDRLNVYLLILFDVKSYFYQDKKTLPNNQEHNTLFSNIKWHCSKSTVSHKALCTHIRHSISYSQGSGQCLEDEPTQNDYNDPDLPPGAMYNAEHQCRLQFGTHTTAVCTPLEEVCLNPSHCNAT
jgi:hypothetical protein